MPLASSFHIRIFLDRVEALAIRSNTHGDFRLSTTAFWLVSLSRKITAAIDPQQEETSVVLSSKPCAMVNKCFFSDSTCTSQSMLFLQQVLIFQTIRTDFATLQTADLRTSWLVLVPLTTARCRRMTPFVSNHTPRLSGRINNCLFSTVGQWLSHKRLHRNAQDAQ